MFYFVAANPESNLLHFSALLALWSFAYHSRPHNTNYCLDVASWIVCLLARLLKIGTEFARVVSSMRGLLVRASQMAPGSLLIV